MSKAASRVTVRDIAAELGLHFTTVAEALRGSRRISRGTRERVRATADRLGYRPDPVLSALSAYRAHKQRHRLQGVLGWVHSHPSKNHFRKIAGFYSRCWESAGARARQYGFEMEDIWLSQPGMTIPRIVQIIKARNISGLLIAPQPLGHGHIDFPWENFCAVRIGYSLRNLALPMVAPDQFHNTFFLFQKLAERGYRRIGFACPQLVDERVDHGFSGGFLAAREQSGATGKTLPPPPLFLDADKDGSAPAFLAWFERHKPDAVMMVPGYVYHPALLKAGCRVPGDVAAGWISTSNHDGANRIGIDENGQKVGEAAVDMLVAQINGNAMGIIPYFRKTLIDGIFVDGDTI
ncbi:MAG: LacI family transcriptional regulator [Opitutaceae bacterium]|jgi:DNA-binding LacI/PurR family transcriptional regulator|nr:LacI family transcriptional regulator [Opitutaceae bacterium]